MIKVASWVMYTPGFEHCWTSLILDSLKTIIVSKTDTPDQDFIAFDISCILLPFQNVVSTLPIMQPGHRVTSLEAISQITYSFVWNHSRFYTTTLSTISQVTLFVNTKKIMFLLTSSGFTLLH